MIEALEKENPGIILTLNREFGIFDFGRYPAELLRRQYESRNDASVPYGVIFYPQADHNSAFYRQKEIFDKLFRRLAGRYELRVCEGSGKLDMIRLFHRLDRKYGAKHKISFVVVGGHGTKETIQFGGQSEAHTLKLADFLDKRHPIRERRIFFEPSPTIILNSCSTGIEGGIGQQLADVLGATVIAPDNSSAIQEIIVEFPEGKPRFDVTHPPGTKTSRFCPRTDGRNMR